MTIDFGPYVWQMLRPVCAAATLLIALMLLRGAVTHVWRAYRNHGSYRKGLTLLVVGLLILVPALFFCAYAYKHLLTT